MNRRDFMFLGALLPVASFTLGCKRTTRCKHCGMKVDFTSPWRAELVGKDGAIIHFDTPRCALISWRSGTTPAQSVRVQDYYDRQMRDGTSVRFVTGGDVLSPMGPDIIPVDPARAGKFVQDHGAERALALEEVTESVLAAIGSK